MQDWDQQVWVGGEIRWAPFGATEEEELRLEGYHVWAIAAWLGTFQKCSSWRFWTNPDRKQAYQIDPDQHLEGIGT